MIQIRVKKSRCTNNNMIFKGSKGVVIMSVVDTNKVDGIGISRDDKQLILLITDHLDWSNEYEHLTQLQNKINSYLGFLEEKQYKEQYPDKEFSSYCIEIHFMHKVTDNCKKFVKVINKQLVDESISIDMVVNDL